MKKYEVNVNGEVYEVTLRELEAGEEVTPSAPKAPQPQAQTKPAASPGQGTSVKAPMAGSILKISVAVGDKVEKGDELLVLEAMKMENQILAPVAGVVQEILVTPSQTVESQEPLLVL